jgi:hypothetical protein
MLRSRPRATVALLGGPRGLQYASAGTIPVYELICRYVRADGQSGHSPKLDYASGTFGVRYHETLDFFRIKGALRCKANNFFGYDFN